MSTQALRNDDRQADSTAGGISGELAKFALELKLEDVPQAVRERAKHLLLDAIGLAYAAHSTDFARVAMDGLSVLGSGDATVIGHGRVLGARDAMVMNGVLAHGLDFDDTHSRGVIHATASVLPCVFGVTDGRPLDGAQTLAAYIAGMEAATRIGSVAKSGFHQVGFHPTGVVGIFGCALAAARLLGLTQQQARMAQGIALSMASGSLEFLQDGAWTKRMHPGWAAQSAYTAAALASRGYVGASAPYEGRFGLFASYLGEQRGNADLALATAALGDKWEIDEVAIKPVPACHFTHAFADAGTALHHEWQRRGYQLTEMIEQVGRIRVKVPEGVVKVVCEPVANKRRPANAYDAQFSVPYVTASALLKGRFTLDELEPAALRDDAVLALAAKVDYEIDPASTFPRHYTGEVCLELANGETLSHREAVNRGSADRPLSNDEIVAKYRANAGRALPEARIEKIRETVLSLDTLPPGAWHAVLGEAV
ncbi:2-methylcitrate dehydratase [Burkholderia sp. SRS-W-2-2016]|uniref:MmgE/PrpD family protein n=1 Tax=Burkholderia sp. SRS-W-2-2016 TaxID=1926878 RepID=UPI00094AC970|nr:MmgE/PrpD family protein [Burkholderia sp. SRS-W-2-2016]OLL27421.1 2-methylcitrate dehydratase [Burkholderia sp. SRS-W-2-2016]